MSNGVRAPPPVAVPKLPLKGIDGVDRIDVNDLLNQSRPRALLALKSGDEQEVDWALNRLLQASFHMPGPGIQFAYLPGLLELLVEYPRRLAHALAGHSPDLWDPVAPPDADSDSNSDSDHEEGPSTLCTQRTTFSPATKEEHKVFLRRALEAAVILRNVAMGPPPPANNALANTTLISRSGMLDTITIVLALYLRHQSLLPATEQPSYPKPLDEVAAAGLNELTLSLLDLVETFADKLRADVMHGLELHRLLRFLAFGPPPPNSEAHQNTGTPDRSMLLCALRILTKMAQASQNAGAFHEEIPSSSDHCWPFTWQVLTLLQASHDTDLLESALELLHELVTVARNGLCFAAYPGLRATSNIPQLPACPNAVALPSLLRVLSVQRTEWPRSVELARPVPKPPVPPPPVYAKRRQQRLALEDAWKRSACQAAAVLTSSNARLVQDQGQDFSSLRALPSAANDPSSPIYCAMRLPEEEASTITGSNVRQKAQQWLTSIFEAEPQAINVPAQQSSDLWEVPQSAFYAAYEEFATDQSSQYILPATDLLGLTAETYRIPVQNLTSTSPGYPGGPGTNFNVRGIRVRADRLVRSIERCATDDQSTLPRLCKKWLQTYLVRSAGAPAWARAGATDPVHRPSGACLWTTCLDPGAHLDAQQQHDRVQQCIKQAALALTNPPPNPSAKSYDPLAYDRYLDARAYQWFDCLATAPRELQGEQVVHWLKAHAAVHLPSITCPAAQFPEPTPRLPEGASWRDENELRLAQKFVTSWSSLLDIAPVLTHLLKQAPVDPKKRSAEPEERDWDGRKRVRLSGEDVLDIDQDGTVAVRYGPLHGEPTLPHADENQDRVPWYLTPGAMALSNPLRTGYQLGHVWYSVARTNMVPRTEIPTGPAATGALLLRAVTAQASDILGTEDDTQEEQQLHDLQQKQARKMTKDQSETVGFPFNPAAAPHPTKSSSNQGERSSQAQSNDTGSIERAVARTWINSLLGAEKYVASHAASNDVLSGILNDALACLPAPRTKKALVGS